MQLERITVSTQDHYKGAQEPSTFNWRNNTYKIEEVLDRWYEGYMDSTRMPLCYYKVKTTDGHIFTLRYHELFTAWSLLVPAEDTET